MSEKEYVLVKTRFIRGKPHYYTERKTIKCIGGESMTKEDPEMMFLDTKDIPVLRRGKRSRDWKKVFGRIPVNKSWIVPKYFASSATLRVVARRINAELEKEAYRVTQRTNKETDTIITYVMRLK